MGVVIAVEHPRDLGIPMESLLDLSFPALFIFCSSFLTLLLWKTQTYTQIEVYNGLPYSYH